MVTIEERVARLEAIEAIRQLEAHYCDHWDSTRPDKWAGLFTPDGTFQRQDVYSVPGHVKTGYDELVEFCETLQVGCGRFHMLNTLDIQVQGPDQASSRIGFQCMMTSTGDYPKQSLVTGYYDTRYRRVDGRWLIETKVERQIFRNDSAYFGVDDDDSRLSNAGGLFANVN